MDGIEEMKGEDGFGWRKEQEVRMVEAEQKRKEQ